MSKHIHSFRLEGDEWGKCKRIYVDGEELTGIREAIVHLTVDDLPRVFLFTDICTANVEINFPEAEIVLKRGGSKEADKCGSD